MVGYNHPPNYKDIEPELLRCLQKFKKFFGGSGGHKLFAEFFGAIKTVDIDFAKTVERLDVALFIFPGLCKKRNVFSK